MDKAKYLYSGIYDGVLAENFIDTIKKEKRPFVKVKIKEFFDGYDEYPLCFVPINFMIYPLKKDDVVKVYYPHSVNDTQFPVLYAVDFDMPDAILSKISLPDDGDIVTFPGDEDTVSFKYNGENSYEIYTDKYTIHKYNDTMIILTEDKIFQYSTSSVNIKTGDYFVETSGDSSVKISGDSSVETSGSYEIKVGGMIFKLDKDSNKFKITNGVFSLKDLIDEEMDILSGLTTFGSPVIHQIFPADKAKLIALKIKYGTLLE